MLTPEEIEQNWNRFHGLCDKLGSRSSAVKSMLDDLDERLCLCPASAKTDYHGAFPGGLVDHSLRVLNHVVALNKTYNWALAKESMILAALFHDIGKIGMPGKSSENDFYVEQKDNWRRLNCGEVYTYNNNLQYMTTPDRSVFVMQHYGVQLTSEEFLAIKLNDGFVLQENKPYCLRITPLVYAIQTADMIATMEEKNVAYWPTNP